MVRWWDWSPSFWWEGEISIRSHKDLSRMACHVLCILITHSELAMAHGGSKLWAERVCMLLGVLLVPRLTWPRISASLFFFFCLHESHPWKDCTSPTYLNTQGLKQGSLLCPVLVQQGYSPRCEPVKDLRAPVMRGALYCLGSIDCTMVPLIGPRYTCPVFSNQRGEWLH